MLRLACHVQTDHNANLFTNAKPATNDSLYVIKLGKFLKEDIYTMSKWFKYRGVTGYLEGKKGDIMDEDMEDWEEAECAEEKGLNIDKLHNYSGIVSIASEYYYKNKYTDMLPHKNKNKGIKCAASPATRS